MTESSHRCKNLVLDSGPLLSLSPLRGLAEAYLTVPQVLEELKDKRAREHFERLGLSAGVRVEVRNPEAASLAHVIQFAKKTGDYSVLSHADICVLALTHSLHVKEKAALEEAEIKADLTVDASQPSSSQNTSSDPSTSRQDAPSDASTVADSQSKGAALDASTPSQFEGNTEVVEDEIDDNVANGEDGEGDNKPREPLNVELTRDVEGTDPQPQPSQPQDSQKGATSPVYDDPSDEDDGEGEWITPGNVALHKSQALSLLPTDADSKKHGKTAKDEVVLAGCMTADFAMQNVLLHMGLSLVNTDGKRIQKLKSWVLRCHACFKICKDNSKQFCPSCGNPTLMRTSVTVASPDASGDAPIMEIHLKRNFQYKMRGTKYSIPAPKPGSAKTGAGEGLVLREDQVEYMRAKKRADGKRERDEQKMLKGLLNKGGEGGVSVGSWSDPDWLPGIMSVGTGGKGRSMRSDGDMPKIGHGRKNPNERRRKT